MGLRVPSALGEPVQCNYSPVCGLPPQGMGLEAASRIRHFFPLHWSFFFVSVIVEDLF